MKRAARKRNPWEDHYSRKAQKEKHPARSVYKLQEIQRKFRIIRRGDSVLDLGCAPGSWLLYAADQVGMTGQVTGIDLEPVSVAVPSHVRVLTGDVDDYLSGSEGAEPLGSNYRVVLSDMAPSTTGNKGVDSARSYRLCQSALGIARDRLADGGSFVCKIFQGEDTKGFAQEVRSCFQTQRIFKPKSSRKASKEIYVIGIGRR